MHSVRLTCFLLGIWLAGGVFMAWVATENFRQVDRLLEHPNLQARLNFRTHENPQNFGPGAARMLLRYQASEQNRFYFEAWESVQVVLGSLLFFFLLFGTREDKYSMGTVLGMLAIVAAQRLVLTPEITSLGRALDFVPANAEALERGRFWLFHNLYSAAELIKWAAALLLVTRLVVGHRRRRSGNAGKQLDVIDKADYRHIDR